ncbi:septum formation initiator family protein [Pseudorhodobacter turbinis]|uniref:Septum formation initiator family protein n=1 Tax=Pseudorhodobacter turbinis TaxID=2500533 RepID=A0A4P8ECW5_9RHOB|nr:septum formation initiator family protein [Pseudorhodobacter turbinis]QCO54622.1 septum formation initiator family protein [Pseudorhodobacter turbinis]
MTTQKSRPAITSLLLMMAAVSLGGYFTFAAVQGDYGVFRQVQLRAEERSLTEQRDKLRAELERMQNLTLRLSDSYLDLDLLDEQARDVLGYLRADEIVIR